MSDGANISYDFGQLGRDQDRLVRYYLRAGTRAIAATTRGLEQDIEGATRSAVPGELWRAWASRVYPKNEKEALDPVGIVFANGGTRTRGALTYWTQPGRASRSGGFYAVPLPAAGAPARVRGQTYELTPAMWEARTGMKLRPVFRRGRAPILVADEAKLTRGRGLAGPNRSKRFGPAARGSTTVAIFTLLPQFAFANAVAVEPLVRRAEHELPQAFVREAGSTR